MKMGETPIRVDCGIDLDGNACRSELGDHRLKIPDSKIDPPGAARAANLRSF
jgi:hypothetical protein